MNLKFICCAIQNKKFKTSGLVIAPSISKYQPKVDIGNKSSTTDASVYQPNVEIEVNSNDI